MEKVSEMSLHEEQPPGGSHKIEISITWRNQTKVRKMQGWGNKSSKG